jgi:microcystin-dependent protein
MKKIAFIFSIFVYGIILGQVPQKLSYQAVIRDASNNIVSNQSVGIRISILQGTPTGTLVYMETHNPMTNKDGLVSIEISGGTVVSGSFSAIDWSKTPYFLFTEVDPTGGVSYSIFSTTELMSVPYALFAEKSRNPGPAGPQGVQGPAGVNGAGVNNAQVINDSLKVTLTNGNIINAGYVKGAKGDTGISITNVQIINDSLKVTLSSGNILNAGKISNSISSGSSNMPIGSIITYAGIIPPSGWAFCNGDTLNRNTYSSLFSIIGTIYGSGDSAYWAQVSMPGRTFNLPDLRARVPVGVGQTSYNSINGGNSVTDLYNLGMRGGEEKHILSIAEMPAHNHSLRPSYGGGGYQTGGLKADPAATGSDSSGLTGGNQQHNVMQPFLVLNYIIKIQ